MKLNKHENHTDVTLVIAAIAAKSFPEDACGQVVCLHLRGHTQPSPQPGTQHLRTLTVTGDHTIRRDRRGVRGRASALSSSGKLQGRWLL